MAVTAALFESGMTMAEYHAQMTQNKDEFAANIANAPVSADDLAAFAAGQGQINALVITEDWCGDSLAHLPVLFRIAQETGDRFAVRVFKRDEHRDLAAQFPMATGRVAIPIIVFYDAAMHGLGQFLERPEIAHRAVALFMEEFFVQHPTYGTPGQPISALSPEARQAVFVELGPWRKARLAEWNRAAVAQFREIAGDATRSA